MTLPRILAIETSCDDTSVATLEGFQVRSNVVYTQVLHEQYGGVVPELASRAHMEALVPTVDSALNKAGWALKDVDAVAVT
ncbi:MAG: tRNA (adenosine(37)-N6)-threonylcarbamoyltransferase complex transferase subunit TsaD, partial [Flavobacteriia bacterium]|nr:tRNA (adenosine(37)-N6)-threonylcarbamoyltransferase complex transferase subunit TsaD [Flavobacteriia bacterium]